MSNNGILNAKELIVNSSWIDYYLIRDYSTWSNFYNTTPLVEDLGENVRTYHKTYRIFENSHGLLMSDGLYYDKDEDIMHTPSACYANWYSKLLLGYKVPRWFIYDFYRPKLTWFSIIPEDDESFAVVRNKCIGLRGYLNNADLTIFDSMDMLNATRNVIVWKNADTYVTQKTEYLFPHEMWYSIKNMDRFTAFDRSTYYYDFSARFDEVLTRFGQPLSTATNLARWVLTATFGADEDDVIPLFLNMDKNYKLLSDNTSGIIWHGYLGQEYLLNFQYMDWSHSIDILNQYMLETYDVTVDMLKYIIPQITFVNGTQLSPYNKQFGILHYNDISSFKLTNSVKSIVTIVLNDDVLSITYMHSGVLYKTDYSVASMKSDFFSYFPDLSSEAVSTMIDEIQDWMELVNSTSVQIPILIIGADQFNSLYSFNKIGQIFVFTTIMWNLVKHLVFAETWADNSNNVHAFRSLSTFDSNVQSMNSTAYDSYSGDARYNAYVDKLLALNMKFKVVPLLSDVFNPSIFDDIRNMSQSVAAYSTNSKFRENYDQATFDLAEPDCKLEFDEASIDSTDLFFLSQSIANIDYEVFRGNDITGIQYQQSGPEYVFVAELDRTGQQEPVSNIKLIFTNDNTRLQYVPVDLEHSNIAKIPYKGLLLLNDVVDGENIQLENVQLQRDFTSNNWQVKLKLLKYDQQDLERTLKFRLYGDTDVHVYQKLAYEFGLGFELVSSENIDNLEILRIMYVLLSQTQSTSNIYVERILQDVDKLKLLFRKLTLDPITLRTVIGYKNDQSILSLFDTII